MDRDSLAYTLHLSGGNRSCRIDQPLLAHCSKLIGHSLGLFPTKRYICFAWVEFTNTTRQGHDLDSIKELVGSIIAYDDRWLLLADFTTDGRVKINSPHITSLHHLHRFSKINSEIRKVGISGCRKKRSNNGTFF